MSIITNTLDMLSNPTLVIYWASMVVLVGWSAYMAFARLPGGEA